jgi:hypothetical protein
MANLANYGINSIPVTGGFLAHNGLNPVGRAFLAADLHAGVKALPDPTMTQSAYLARVNVTYAWWAHKRQAERAAIEAGLVPLLPARPVVLKTNGNMLAVQQSTTIADSELIDIARYVGSDRMLAAAMVAEAAQ